MSTAPHTRPRVSSGLTRWAAAVETMPLCVYVWGKVARSEPGTGKLPTTPLTCHTFTPGRWVSKDSFARTTFSARVSSMSCQEQHGLLQSWPRRGCFPYPEMWSEHAGRQVTPQTHSPPPGARSGPCGPPGGQGCWRTATARLRSAVCPLERQRRLVQHGIRATVEPRTRFQRALLQHRSTSRRQRPRRGHLGATSPG